MKSVFLTCAVLIILTIVFTSIHAKVLREHFPERDAGACGGVIEANKGTIEFNLTNDEPIQCVWTLQAISDRRLVYDISYLFEDGNLNNDEDEIGLSLFQMNFNMAPSRITPIHIPIDAEDKDRTYVPPDFTPIGFSVIVFHTTSVNKNKWFRLSFEALEQRDESYLYYNYITEEDSGEIRYPEDPTAPTYRHDDLATFIVSNKHFRSEEETLEEILLQFDFVEVEDCGGEASYVDFKCNCDGVTVFEIKDDTSIAVVDNEICGWGGGYGYYSNHGFLIAFVTDGNNGEERPGIGFRFNWKNLNRLPELSTTEAGVTPKPITPIQGAFTECGGVLDLMEGYIEYKLNEDYVPNEFCVWTIRWEEGQRISFAKEESGLVVGEDVITITMLEAFQDVHAHQQVITTTQLNAKYGGKEEFSLLGSVALIVFTSNGENEGRGFRLKYTAYVDGFKYVRDYNDVGGYGLSGEFGHGPSSPAWWFSTFVVAPSLPAADIGFVDLFLKNLDLKDTGSDGSCYLNVLFLYEILPSSPDLELAGHIQERNQLCNVMGDISFPAQRGFFGLLMTTKRWGNGIQGYDFSYSVVPPNNL